MNEENMIDLLAAYPSGEPDEWDKEMIARITPSRTFQAYHDGGI